MAQPQQRLSQISSHLSPPKSGRSKILEKNPDDIVRAALPISRPLSSAAPLLTWNAQVITYAIRSALTNSKKGAFRDTPLEDLLIAILTGVREKSRIDPSKVEEIVFGNVLQNRINYISRGATLAAGFPATTATSIASRWCSSGLLATQSVANQIKAGCIEVGIAVGAESMSQNPDDGAPEMGPGIMSCAMARDIKMPMGWTSENLAGDFGISREVQDEWAAESSQKAERAQKAGWSVDEILPITVSVKDKESGTVKQVVADKDDGVRYGTTKEKLAKIRNAFPQWPPSTTTGGNASQITDGVAALLLMKRSTAEKLGQPIVGKYVSSTVAGLEPRIMGAGPTVAVPKLLNSLGLSIQDIDLFEINEAFGSVVSLF